MIGNHMISLNQWSVRITVGVEGCCRHDYMIQISIMGFKQPL